MYKRIFLLLRPSYGMYPTAAKNVKSPKSEQVDLTQMERDLKLSIYGISV